MYHACVAIVKMKISLFNAAALSFESTAAIYIFIRQIGSKKTDSKAQKVNSLVSLGPVSLIRMYDACCLVPVREIYFAAPRHSEPSVNYIYYSTSNVTGAVSDVVGGRVYSAETLSHVRQLTVTAAVPARLRCHALGGYPAPRLRVLVGDRDVTEHFRRKSTRVLRGVVGMRVIHVRSELFADDWTVDAADDQATVRCTAFVDRSLGEQFAAITLYVNRTSFCLPLSLSESLSPSLPSPPLSLSLLPGHSFTRT